MIDVIALILYIIGVVLIMFQSDKKRLAGFLVLIVGTVFWITYGYWIIQSWALVILFIECQVLWIMGAVGCYGTIKKAANPIQ